MRLGWGALLELRKLFTFEEMTDSRLELMRLFLFSSKKNIKTKSHEPAHTAAPTHRTKEHAAAKAEWS